MSRILLLFLFAYVFTIIGFVIAGGDVGSYPKCSLGESEPCVQEVEGFRCPTGYSFVSADITDTNCCCEKN
ncbi:CLUMA_CG021311, isoform A [Clunio marinus]|uniref:CLUMA_CG021311, isoform A n=1 Tax=Clunio marinus TaxID=568069 RepID=A0A1J1J8Q3_9DIPT|nr:CLUMA_CG021311, isoform A [Clunio marinus]